MKDLPGMGRPYEKCPCHDPEGLTDTELLAVIIRTGSRGQSSLALPKKLLALGSPGDGLLGLLHHSLNDFMKVKGVGKVKGVQLSCVGKFSRRIWKRRARVNPISFRNSRETSDYYMGDMRHLEQKEIRITFLDTKQVLIKDYLTSRGTVNVSITTSCEILIEALRYCVVSMVLVHNHPSGDPTSSRVDRMLIGRVKEAGTLIGITLADHITIGNGRYLSFHEQKIL